MLRAALLLTGAVSALKPASRRLLLKAAPAVATGLIAAPALAEDFQASLKPLYKAAKTAKLTYRSKAGEPPPEAWAEDAFVGRYTDPINHPGGIRDITLTDTFIGEYRLVKVVGGGGRGEPKEYVLPGLVDASAQIKFCTHVPREATESLVDLPTGRRQPDHGRLLRAAQGRPAELDGRPHAADARPARRDGHRLARRQQVAPGEEELVLICVRSFVS